MKSQNIKDYKVGTRILYSHFRHQARQYEAIISEFSDSGEYVCLEYALDKTNDWYNVKDIIIFDTLKSKKTPLNSVDYERLEAESIEKECEDYELTKDTMIFYDEVDQKMTEEDWNSFGEFHNKPESKEEKEVKPNALEIYPPASEKGKPVYFLEIYNGERWKLCMRTELDFSVPKFGWSSEGHPYTLGEGKIASKYLINMYTLKNLTRIVDGLNLVYEKDHSPLPSTTFEPSRFRNKEKIDWQKDFPHSITTSP